MSVLIRRAHPEDVDALQGLVRGSACTRLPRIDQAYLSHAEVYGAWEGTQLVGFFALEGRGGEWRLPHLWVAPASGGRSRGRWLLADAVRRARRSGAEVLRLTPEPDAEGFFARLGARRTPDGGMEIEPVAWLEPLPESVSELGWSE